MRRVDPVDLVETIREGLLVLESDLTVSFANRSFCHTFSVAPEHTVGRKLYELGNGQWDIPKLCMLLETIVSDQKTIEAFEVDHVFPAIGRRAMLLNARTVRRAGSETEQILVAIEDVTERVRLEPSTGRFRGRRPAGRRLRPTARRPGRAGERQPGYDRAPNLAVARRHVGICAREESRSLIGRASRRHPANAISWSGRASLLTFPKHTRKIASSRRVR